MRRPRRSFKLTTRAPGRLEPLQRIITLLRAINLRYEGPTPTLASRLLRVSHRVPPPPPPRSTEQRARAVPLILQHRPCSVQDRPARLHVSTQTRARTPFQAPHPIAHWTRLPTRPSFVARVRFLSAYPHSLPPTTAMVPITYRPIQRKRAITLSPWSESGWKPQTSLGMFHWRWQLSSLKGYQSPTCKTRTKLSLTRQTSRMRKGTMRCRRKSPIGIR